MYRSNEKFRDHISTDENSLLDYNRILMGIRNNVNIFGPVKILSIQRSGFEGRYECLLECDGITHAVIDPVIIEHFLLFAERVTIKIMELCKGEPQ